MSNEFNFCPNCGARKISYVDEKKWKCGGCGFTLYNNVASAVGVILSDSAGNVLLETRAKEPRKGFLAFPGGFTNPDERAEDAAVRECFEETGIRIDASSLRFVATFPNIYVYKEIQYKTCDIFFSAELPSGIATVDELIAHARRELSEVAGLTGVRVTTEQELAEIPLAFESARRTLSLWLKMHRAASGSSLK